MFKRTLFDLSLTDASSPLKYRHTMDMNDPTICRIEQNADLARLIGNRFTFEVYPLHDL